MPTEDVPWKSIARAAAMLDEEDQNLRARCRAAFAKMRARGESAEIAPLGGGVLAMRLGGRWRVHVPTQGPLTG